MPTILNRSFGGGEEGLKSLSLKSCAHKPYRNSAAYIVLLFILFYIDIEPIAIRNVIQCQYDVRDIIIRDIFECIILYLHGCACFRLTMRKRKFQTKSA